jgi:hypothetical protein
VQSDAGELEKAIRVNAEAAEVKRLQENCTKSLAALLAQLRPALPQEQQPEPAAPPVAPVDPGQLEPLVMQMRNQLSEFDAAAADTFDANRHLLAALFPGPMLGQFEKHLQDYAFSEAQALLESAAKPLGI